MTLTVLWDRRTGEVGGDPELDSGGVVGSMSKDSEAESSMQPHRSMAASMLARYYGRS